MEIVEICEKYKAIAEDVIAKHEDLHWIRKMDVDIGYLASDKEKQSKGRLVFGECIKVKEIYRPYIPHDFLIVIYEANTAAMTEEQLHILLYHELLHIGLSERDDELVYVIEPHDIEEFRSVADRYGLDWAR